jgi:hypothetical protein
MIQLRDLIVISAVKRFVGPIRPDHGPKPFEVRFETPEGKKELIGFTEGARESAQNWRELLLDLKARGSRPRPSSRLPMAASASGRRSARSGR